MSAVVSIELDVSDDRRARVLKSLVAAAMAAGFLLSPKLWLSTRSYPLVPVLDFLPTVRAPFDFIYFAVLLGLLGVAPLERRPIALSAFLVMAGLWATLDQTRLQPWFYQYWIMLLLLACARRRTGDADALRGGLNACRFVVASTYFWSGAQKLNHSFYHVVYPWLIEPLQDQLPQWAWHRLSAGAHAAPYVEMMIGIGLLIPYVRYAAAACALMMHAMLLYLLSPLNHDWNSVVWPWNVAMSLIVVVLFIRYREWPWRIVLPKRFLPARVTVVLFGILPALSFYGWWDAYLSSALYSGNTLEARIYLRESAYDALTDKAKDHVVQRPFFDIDEVDVDDYPYRAQLFQWAIDELNVPPNPARRVYRGIARRLAERGGHDKDVVLIIDERPNARTGKREGTREPF